MLTLYRIGFCSVSKVAPVQCEQELMFCFGAEIVSKRSQCEQKPYPSYNLQRSLLIWKDYLPKWGSVAISAPIKVFRLDLDRFKNLSDTERSTFNSGAEQYCSGAETASKAAFRILSRIFCLGESRSCKNFWATMGVWGHASLENFENIVFRIGWNCISGH